MTSDDNKTPYEIAQEAKERMEQCDCGRHYNPEYTDGDYCRSCMMDKKVEQRKDDSDS
jgi:hypothetical protein